MDAKITKLTPEQEARLGPYIEEWFQAVTSTEPVDPHESNSALVRLYEAAGLERPRTIVRAASPLQAARLGCELATTFRLEPEMLDEVYGQMYDQVDAQVCNQVDARVYDQVCDQVCNQVCDPVYKQMFEQVHAQVQAQAYDQVDAQVYAQVYKQVYAQVHTQVYVQVHDQVCDQVCDQVYDQVYGQVNYSLWRRLSLAPYESDWNAARTFFAAEGVIQDPSGKAEAWRDEALLVGCWWGARGFAVISERPTEMHWGENRAGERVLHNLSGPAILWADGFAVYSVEGVRVPRAFVEDPEWVTIERIREEKNAEVRRLMIESYGWTRYLEDVGAEVIAMDSVPIESWNESAGSIERALVQTDEGRYLIACDGSTDRTYTMRAPDDAVTPEEAYRAIAGVKSEACIAQG